jgi:type I restriction enzyme S subunit
MSNKQEDKTMQSAEKHALVPKLRFPEFQDAGEWEIDHLGQAAEFVSERIQLEKIRLENYVSTENILPNFGGVVKASNLPTTGSITRFKINDVLVSNIRPYLKKVWRSDKDGGASNDVIVLRAKQYLVEQFFPFILRNDAFIDYVMKGAKGVKMPRGDVSLMRQYPIGYPSPAEQQKIADCLASIDEVITLEAQKLDTLKTHKKGLMQQLFPAEGETLPKLRFPEFRDAGEWGSEFGDVLFDQISNKNHNSDLPVLAITQEQGAIPRNLIDYHVSVTEKSIESYKVVEAGDFIISLRSFQVGIEYSSYKGICSPAYVILRLKAGYSAGYFKHFLKTSRFIALLIKNLEGLRDGKMVSYKQFSELQLPTPSRNEQQKIADCLASLDDHITAQTQKLAALKTHKKGLMQQLLPAPDEVQG